MQIQGTKVFVTGANRGLGRALVGQLLERGAETVYAAARNIEALPKHERVVPVRLDITRPEDVTAAAARVDSLDLLINNAGLLVSSGVVDGQLDAIERDMQTNYFGTLAITRALLPAIEKRKGALANVLSVVSFASMPALGGYSASKAAAYSLTQALRGELGKRGLRVHAVFPGPIDTDMIKSFEMPKTSAADVARGLLEGLVRGDDDIFPDPMSMQVGTGWLKAPKEVEKMFAAM
jgi:NAD(P)-dependent dehydrogenase (short-subunit alcohol dehydrogenase family)